MSTQRRWRRSPPFSQSETLFSTASRFLTRPTSFGRCRRRGCSRSITSRTRCRPGPPRRSRSRRSSCSSRRLSFKTSLTRKPSPNQSKRAPSRRASSFSALVLVVKVVKMETAPVSRLRQRRWGRRTTTRIAKANRRLPRGRKRRIHPRSHKHELEEEEDAGASATWQRRLRWMRRLRRRLLKSCASSTKCDSSSSDPSLLTTASRRSRLSACSPYSKEPPCAQTRR
mmetsp:Transcript_21826/g.70477  ORF Transcript_21826/g.70477 Transcript_21826/m.70477 type:complete len:227 (-) Transcript_21826:1229-1909(-)